MSFMELSTPAKGNQLAAMYVKQAKILTATPQKARTYFPELFHGLMG